MRSKVLFLFLLISLCLLLPNLSAQMREDYQLVEEKVAHPEWATHYHHDTKLKAHWNPLRFLIRLGLFVYQKELTYQVTGNCPYSPSCSSFSRDAFQTFGPVRGYLLTVDRLARCNRLSHAGEVRQFGKNPAGKIDDPVKGYKKRKKK